jgi:hypothetical protein
MHLIFSINVNRNGVQRKWLEIAMYFAAGHWQRLFKAIRLPLGAAKRIKESRWEMLKGYWIASGQFLKVLISCWELPRAGHKKR